MSKALGTAPGISACSASTNFKDPSSFGSLSVLVTSCLRHLLQEAFPDYRDACSILLFVAITPRPPPHFHFNCLILVSHSRMDPHGRRVWGVYSMVLSDRAPDGSSESICWVKGLTRKATSSRSQGTGGPVESWRGILLNSATESAGDRPLGSRTRPFGTDVST